MDTLQTVLEAALRGDNATRGRAEEQLFALQRAPGFLGKLCQIAGDSRVDTHVRLNACVTFNNSVRRNWARKADRVAHRRDAVFSVADKSVVKAHVVELLMVLDARPLVSTMSQAVTEICFREFPDHWESLLAELDKNLKRVDELRRINNCLVLLVEIAKKYENKDRARWGPMIMISDRLMPVLLLLLQSLASNTSLVAATLVTLIARIVYSVTTHQVANFTQDATSVANWYAVLNKILGAPLAEPGTAGAGPCQPSDVEQREEWPWWEAKGAIIKLLDNTMNKFGNVKNIPASNTADVKFGTIFCASVVPHVTPTVLGLLHQRFKAGKFVSTAVVVHALGFVRGTIKTPAYQMIKPHLAFLISSVIAPLCCFTDKDQQMWIDDPHEFIRVQYSPLASVSDPRSAAQKLLLSLVRPRPKAVMSILWPLWEQVLTQHARTPNYRAKDGVLLMFATLKDFLVESPVWYTKVEPFLVAHVMPDFDAPAAAPYLKARACWMIAEFAESGDFEFEDGAKLGYAASRIVQAMKPDQQLPVQFTAAASLYFLARSDSPEVEAVMSANITTVVAQLLRLMDELAVDNVVSSLEELVVRFGKALQAHVVPLIKRLLEVWGTYVEDADKGDDEASLSAHHCLDTIHAVVPLTADNPAIYRQVEAAIMPLIAILFDLKAKNPDNMEAGCDLLHVLAHHAPAPLTDVMWAAYGAMLKAFYSHADDYVNHLKGPISDFLAKDTERFLRTEASGVNHLQDVGRIVAYTLKHRPESDRGSAMSLLFMVMHNCPGRVDPYVRVALDVVLPELQTSRRTDYKVQLCLVVLSAFIYNAPLTVAHLAAKGAMEGVMSGLFSIMPAFETQLQYRIGVLGLCALLHVPHTSLPPAVAKHLAPIVGLLIDVIDNVQLGTIASRASMSLASRRALAGRGPLYIPTDTGAEEDDDGDEVWVGGGAGGAGAGAGDGGGEDLADDGFEADARETAFNAAVLEQMAKQAAAVREAVAKGLPLPEDCVEEFDDFDPAEWQDEDPDADYTSPLDNLNVHVVFRDTVLMCGKTPAGAALAAALTPDQQQRCQEHMAIGKVAAGAAGTIDGAGKGAGSPATGR